MEGLQQFRHLLGLKDVMRETEVRGRKESPAEHSWSALVLADYILSRTDIDVDRGRVFQLLLYHDVVEIEAGDTFELNDVTEAEQAEKEQAGMAILMDKLPREIAAVYGDYFKEFEECSTPEARFAVAIDKLEPMIHQLDHKEDWRKYGYTVAVLNQRKGRYMEPFPELKGIYDSFIDYLVREDYVDSE